MTTPHNPKEAKTNNWPNEVFAFMSYQELVPAQPLGGKRKQDVRLQICDRPLVTFRSAGAFNLEVERKMLEAVYTALEMRKVADPSQSLFSVDDVDVRILYRDKVTNHVDLD